LGCLCSGDQGLRTGEEGLRLESHADLWTYKDEVAEELGSWVRTAFKLAGSMHKNCHENLATREDVEDALGEVRRLVDAVAWALGKGSGTLGRA
jgi:hypothetical protein